MSLPPEQITLRRKRGAEALESLYIENEGHQGKRYRSAAHSSFFYTRLDGDVATRKHDSRPVEPPPRQIPTSQIPIVRTTLTDEDQNVATPKPSMAVPSRVPLNGNLTAQTSESKGNIGMKGDLRLRAFRLARTDSNNANRPSVINGGINKYRKKRKGAIPLFVEKSIHMIEDAAKKQSLYSSVNHDNEHSREATVVAEAEYQTPQKRPIVTAAEKEWRSRNWANVQASRNLKEGQSNARPTVTKLIPLHHDPIDLAVQLSDLVMMEAQKPQAAPLTANSHASKSVLSKSQLSKSATMDAHNPLATPDTVNSDVPKRISPKTRLSGSAMIDTQGLHARPETIDTATLEIGRRIAKFKSKLKPQTKNMLKFQPKPPRDRSQRNQQDTVMADAENNSEAATTDVGNDGEATMEDVEDQDYVYDTFFRRPIESALGSLNAGDDYLNQSMNMETTGLLVIEPEDKEIWETFMEDDGSDGEFASDEDDENAEDYYGNDYPEDEVESDDEYGRSVYQYHKDGSDDDDDYGDEAEGYEVEAEVKNYDVEAMALSEEVDKLSKMEVK